jgi:hypothetical protein
MTWKEDLARQERELLNAQARETLLAAGYVVRRGENGNVVVAEKPDLPSADTRKIYASNETELLRHVEAKP